VKITVNKNIYPLGVLYEAANDFKLIADIKLTPLDSEIEVECLDSRGWIVEEFLNYVLIDLAMSYR